MFLPRFHYVNEYGDDWACVYLTSIDDVLRLRTEVRDGKVHSWSVHHDDIGLIAEGWA